MSKCFLTLDEAVIDAYCQRTDSVDDILTDPLEAMAFAQAVLGQLDPEANMEARAILRRLVTLRKRGEDRGGLPTSAARNRKPR